MVVAERQLLTEAPRAVVVVAMAVAVAVPAQVAAILPVKAATPAKEILNTQGADASLNPAATCQQPNKRYVALDSAQHVVTAVATGVVMVAHRRPPRAPGVNLTQCVPAST